MAFFDMRVSGTQTVRMNLGRVQRRMAAGLEAGLVAAGLHLQRTSQQLAPVEFGNLRGSAYTIRRGSGFNTVVEVGYKSPYALYVHEKVGMVLRGQTRTPSPPHQGKYWDPQGQAQAKFLEQPARTEIPTMLRIIRLAARII